MHLSIPTLPTNAWSALVGPGLLVALRVLLLQTVLVACSWASAQDAPSGHADLVEPHHRIAAVVSGGAAAPAPLALTLDACSGRFDDRLMNFLIAQRIPATLFVTKRWMRRNPEAIALIRAHADLFDVENHGERHIPAVIGAERTVFGLVAHADVAALRREVTEGGRAIEAAFGRRPQWYRGATALYDRAAMHEIQALGYRIAGFSINADSGARLHRHSVKRRLATARAGDVIIGHINHPESDSGPGLIEGLTRLQDDGHVFVRLSQVDLVELAPARKRKAAPATGAQRSSTSTGDTAREQQGRN